jgi:hypothetical protein
VILNPDPNRIPIQTQVILTENLPKFKSRYFKKDVQAPEKAPAHQRAFQNMKII